jgi:hypothetical protein
VSREIIPKLVKQLRRRNIPPLLGGNVVHYELSEEHNSHILEGGRRLRGFSYRELHKWKHWMEEELLCSKCKTSLLTIAAYLKCHVAEYPHTRKLCMRIMRHHLTLEGQKMYEDYPEIRASIYDHTLAKKPVPEELLNNELYQCELSCLRTDGRKMFTREFPSINAFPSFELNKESKMWLCDLEPPSQDKVEELKQLLRQLFRKHGPAEITVPAAEAVLSLSPNLYSDGHVPKPDYEKPTITWMYSFTYQKFKTNPLTEREVWLPPKAYKLCSTWWHFIMEPIAKRVPYVICNDTLTEVRKNLHKRFSPSTKIDLKGFGLQFPKEYAIAVMDVFTEFYPSEEAEEYKNLAKKLFATMSIKMPNEKFIKNKRGVGLGYFANIMTIAIAAILNQYNIVSMFSDDILCPTERAEEAIQRLEHFDFIINEKKTGKKWHKAPFFAGVCMAPNGSLRFYEAQGEKASLHTKRYHYERKNIFLSINYGCPWKIGYHLERLYGFEVRPGECFEHPDMLGLNPLAPRPVGYVKGGNLRNYKTPKADGDETQRRIWAISFPWKEPKKRKTFQQIRNKVVKEEKNRIHYTEYEEYLNPRIENRDKVIASSPDFMLGSYQLPRWADIQMLLATGRTCGRVTKGRHPKLAARMMLDNLLAQDPITSWLLGGYEVISDFYRIPGLTPDMHLLYEKLRTAMRYSRPSINKRKGEESIQYLVEGSGLSFLEKVGVNTILSVEEEDNESIVSDEDYDNDNLILDENYDEDVNVYDDSDIDSSSEGEELNFDF